MIALIPQFANNSTPAPAVPQFSTRALTLTSEAAPAGHAAPASAPLSRQSEFQRKLEEHSSRDAHAPDSAELSRGKQRTETPRIAHKSAEDSHPEQESRNEPEQEIDTASNQPPRTNRLQAVAKNEAAHKAPADPTAETCSADGRTSSRPKQIASRSPQDDRAEETPDDSTESTENGTQLDMPLGMQLAAVLAAQNTQQAIAPVPPQTAVGAYDENTVAVEASGSAHSNLEVGGVVEALGAGRQLPVADATTQFESIVLAEDSRAGGHGAEALQALAANLPEQANAHARDAIHRTALRHEPAKQQQAYAAEPASITADNTQPEQDIAPRRSLESLLEQLPEQALEHGTFNGVLGTQPKADAATNKPRGGEIPVAVQTRGTGAEAAPPPAHGEQRQEVATVQMTSTPSSPAEAKASVAHENGQDTVRTGESHAEGESSSGGPMETATFRSAETGDAGREQHAGTGEHSAEGKHAETARQPLGTALAGTAPTAVHPAPTDQAAPAGTPQVVVAGTPAHSESPAESTTDSSARNSLRDPAGLGGTSLREATLRDEPLRSGQPARIDVSLTTEELGSISMRATARHEYVSATLAVESPELRGLLHAHMPALEQTLAERRIPVESIQLADTNSFGHAATGNGANGFAPRQDRPQSGPTTGSEFGSGENSGSLRVERNEQPTGVRVIRRGGGRLELHV